MHRSLLVLPCAPRSAVVPASAKIDLYIFRRSMPFFDLKIRWAESSILKSGDLGHRILKSEFYAVGCCTIGPHKKTDPFFRSKSKYLKPGIGWHKKHEIDCVSSNPAKGIFRAQKKISRYR